MKKIFVTSLVFGFLTLHCSPLAKQDPAPLAAGDCPLEFKNLELCADLSWIDYPSGSQKGLLSLKFWEKAEGSISGPYLDPPGLPFVYLWMPEHGHGSSPVKTVGNGVGQFQVSNVFFVMPGNWDFHVQIKQENKVIDEVTFRYVAP